MSLGNKIRKTRIEKGLKIVEVAEKTGLTSSTISQVEREIISPSIDTLKKIGNVLGVPISYFFEEVEKDGPDLNYQKSPVVHEDKRKILQPNNGVTFYLLNPDMSGPIEFIYNIYEPGASTGEGFYSHEGTECGLILEGELEVQIGEKKYLLKEGDSITFSSEEPHRKENVGKKRCICVWANTPPYF